MTIEEDTQRVTAEVARLKRVTIGALAVTAAAVALAVVALSRSLHVELPTGPAALDASEVTVRDQNGNVRGRWTVQGLSLADENGRMRAGLNLSDQGAPTLTLFSATGSVRAVVGLGSGDSPAITLHDEKSRVRTRIVVGADAAPSVVIVDQDGNVIGRLPAPVATPALKARTGRRG